MYLTSHIEGFTKFSNRNLSSTQTELAVRIIAGRNDTPPREDPQLWRAKSSPARSLILAADRRRTFHITHLLALKLLRCVGCPATFGSLQEQWGKSETLWQGRSWSAKSGCPARVLALAWVPALFCSSLSPCTDHWFQYPFATSL